MKVIWVLYNSEDCSLHNRRSHHFMRYSKCRRWSNLAANVPFDVIRRSILLNLAISCRCDHVAAAFVAPMYSFIGRKCDLFWRCCIFYRFPTSYINIKLTPFLSCFHYVTIHYWKTFIVMRLNFSSILFFLEFPLSGDWTKVFCAFFFAIMS